jgi:DNA-binding protein HU-beta
MPIRTTPRTKSEIIAALADAAGIEKKQAAAAYTALLDIAYAGAKNAEGIMLPGLGKLIKQKRPKRSGRNPATGETITIPAKTVVKFRLAKACKDAIVPPKKVKD